MISIQNSVVERAIDKYRTVLAADYKAVKNALKQLPRQIKAGISASELAYLNKVIKVWAQVNLIIADKKAIQKAIMDIGELPPRDKEQTINLKEEIIKALGYAAKRKTFYARYFADIGIKTCVYCNAQLAVTVSETDKDASVVAKFQVDHHLAQFKYPFLVISLYNLYPCCPSCNHSKGKKGVTFDLYAADPKDSPFHFRLCPNSKVDYLLSGNLEELKIIFEGGVDGYDSTFDISGIYQTQVDIVAEMIQKTRVYNPAFKAMLVRSLGRQFKDPQLYQRMILGNYSETSEIHNRPMAKFMQDIASELGLM